MRRLLPIFCLFCCNVQSAAELVALKDVRRHPFAERRAFGDVGEYEVIHALAWFEIDPKVEANRAIVDIAHAPRNGRGKVEFLSQVTILAPKDPGKGNGAVFYDVNNRGNKLALRFFNFSAGGNDLLKKGAEGDGFLMAQGYTVVWCGWIGEIWPGDERLRLQAPPVLIEGQPVRGRVRFEMSCDKPADSLPLSRREGHATYQLVEGALDSATLTVRDLVEGKREAIPRERWSLTTVKAPPGPEGLAAPTQSRLELKGGFVPGKLYELIGECEGAFVQGTGFAAVRDLVSFLRHDVSAANPLRTKEGKPAINRAYSFGVSQSGRFLRHFLYQGFNEDEKGRMVFEGLIPHVAGGGLGFFNHRFAQPTRHNGQHEDHHYPADIFPFTYGPSFDPFRKVEDAILAPYAKSKVKPKVMHTQSAAEYWHRSGSLVHTDPLGKGDAVIPDNVRIYAFGGTQHGPAADPPSKGIAQNLANPGDYRPFLRGLLVALDAWVREGRSPPPSLYPRIADKTLVPWDQKSTGFPDLPGVRYPKVIQQPAFRDHGDDFWATGVIQREPPEARGDYVVLVPRSDADGNDLGTLLIPDVAVPLATYTGWNLRSREVGAEDQLANLLGSYIPFARTRAEREKAGDPRASIEERYGDMARYAERYRRACDALVDQRYLLRADADAFADRASRRK